MLFELTSGVSLFHSDRAADNIVGDAAKVELLNWRTVDARRLELIFAECKTIDPTKREDARHLITWCLQSDPERRPTMEQVLAHRFLLRDLDKGQGAS